MGSRALLGFGGTIDNPQLEGRAACVRAAMRAVQDASGRGRVVSFVGLPGSGRTTILSMAAAIAADHGLQVAAATSWYGPTVPYGALLSALTSGDEALIHLDSLADVVSTGIEASIIRSVAARLRRAAEDAPVAVVIDDIDRADEASITAVRRLTLLTRDSPIVWFLTAAEPEALPSRSTITLLEPLDDSAVRRLAQTIGVPEDVDPVAASCLTDRQPARLVALFRGLREEAESAAAASAAPQRLRRDLSGRLLTLPENQRSILAAASVLPGGFDAAEIAELLGRPVERVRRQIRPLIAQGLLADGGGRVGFRQDYLRIAVQEELSPTLLRSLRRRSLALPGRSDDADLIRELLDVAEAGDVDAVRLLDQAARALEKANLAGAARILSRALELAPTSWEPRFSLVIRAVFALSRSGDLDAARALAEREQTGAAYAANDTAELHLRLSEILGQQSFTKAVWHADAGLAVGPTSAVTEARLRAHRLVNLGLAGRAEKSLAELPQALALLERGIDDGSASAVLLAASYVSTLACDWSGAVEMADRADSLARRVEDTHQHWVAMTWRPLLLSQIGSVDSALADIDRGVAEAERRGDVAFRRQLQLTLSKVLLDAGRLPDALSTAGSALQAVEGAHTDNVAAATAGVAYCRAALAIGEPGTVRRAAERARAMTQDDSILIRSMGWWIESVAADSLDQPERAARLLAEAIAPHSFAGRDVPELQFTEPADGPLMLGVAHRGGRDDLAIRVLDLAEIRAKTNHDIPLFVALGLHCHGVFHEDLRSLDKAIEMLRTVGRPLPLANALEDAAAIDPEFDRAILRLDEALRLSLNSGAERRAARIRRRLRDRGVHRRRAKGVAGDRAVEHSSAAFGRDEIRLTRAERDVVDLVVEGSTNREIAAVLSLSVHTVSTHLRHVFEKVGVSSRTELALAVRQRAAEGGSR